MLQLRNNYRHRVLLYVIVFGGVWLYFYITNEGGLDLGILATSVFLFFAFTMFFLVHKDTYIKEKDKSEELDKTKEVFDEDEVDLDLED